MALAIAWNLAIGPELPPFVNKLLTNVGNVYPFLALFSIGLSFSNGLPAIKGDDGIRTLVLLITAKVRPPYHGTSRNYARVA